MTEQGSTRHAASSLRAAERGQPPTEGAGLDAAADMSEE